MLVGNFAAYSEKFYVRVGEFIVCIETLKAVDTVKGKN